MSKLAGIEARPPEIHAHVAIDGWGDFANGAIHPLVNPAQILVLIGLALLIGQQDPLRFKHPLLVFSSSLAVALTLTAAGVAGAIWQPFLSSTALCFGLFIAIGKPISTPILSLLCAFAALVLGLDSGTEGKSEGWASIVQTLGGTWLSLCILVAYLSLASSNATGKPWAMTAVKIAGSWLVAISLMILAFSLRK